METRVRAQKLFLLKVWLLCAGSAAAEAVVSPEMRIGRLASSGFDPIVPVVCRAIGFDQSVRDLRRINATTGLRRFFIVAPGFNDVMYQSFPEDLYEKIGGEISMFKDALADTDVEISWWCSPSIRYVSSFAPVVDSAGNTSVDNKKCPLDPDFAADFTAKICSVAKHHPAFVCIEDDYTLSWGRGLDHLGPCFCNRHMKSFAEHYGKALKPREIAEAFKTQRPDNRSIRRAFTDTIRDSLVQLARQVREAVDLIDPNVRIMLCQPGRSDLDGDATEAVARAFAGKTRPAVRPCGAIYSGKTTPEDIPVAISHTIWTLERLPKDVETFYEADTYPHNRFFSSAAQLTSLMTGALMAGSDDFLFYCLQYLDDPLEDRGYFDAYARLRPRFERVRSFVRDRRARLTGVRQVWKVEDLSLTRGFGLGHGAEAMRWMSYMLSRFGVPYTTRSEKACFAMLVDGTADSLEDKEILELLSNGLFLDARAAEILAARGFAKYLGVDVEPVKNIPALGEEILPAAGCTRPGKLMNAYFLLSAGSEGSVERFVELTPHEGTETLSKYTGLGGVDLSPSVTYATNALGGRVAVMATSLPRNRTSGLYNLRKQELLQRLFVRLSGDGIPVMAPDVPGLWLLANVSEDEREMLLMVNNLSGDVRSDVSLRFGAGWRGAEVFRLADDGDEVRLGVVSENWRVPFVFGQMLPEFLILRRGK